jgi:putative ABC transport system permease protein
MRIASPLLRPRSLLALRFATRELRAGARGFYLFIALIALGVAAIAGIGSAANSLAEGLAEAGRVVLGGDLVFSLVNREADTEEFALLATKGRLSVSATLRAMARANDGNAALVEIKAVDANYPLYGVVTLDPSGDLADALALRGGAYGAAADPALLARLGVLVGAELHIADAIIAVRATLASEPDKLAVGVGFGPRLLLSTAALRATGLLLPGSLIRWNYRLRVRDEGKRSEDVIKEVQAQLPNAGWEIRTAENASPELGRNIKRVSQFLSLVGLTSLLVGGVGVANATKSYLDRKREVIATFKALGATGAGVFAIYLTQLMMLALVGIMIGLSVGAALPFLIVAIFGRVIPVPITPALYGGVLALAFLYGILTALAFALWPLGRAHDLPVSALFRDEVAPKRQFPRLRYIVGAAAALGALAGLAIVPAFDERIAAIFVASAAAVFAVLRALALLLMQAARRVPPPSSPLLRLVLADIARPGALTSTIVLSLGVGLALLVTLTQIDGNLRREFAAGLPERAPAFYFLDLQHADVKKFESFVRAQAPGAKLERVFMLRGRIISAHGVNVEQLRPPANLAWVLQSDRGMTEAAELPAGSRVVAGAWWGPGYNGPALVSVENRIAQGLGLKLGDRLVVNVLGRNLAASVANLRAVDWETLGINFVLVFSPGTFAGAPHSDIATLTYPQGMTGPEEGALIKAAAASFPAVTTIRVKDVLEAIGNLVRNLMLAVRGASAITLVSAVLVLAGALATGHRHRVYDAVVLKVLGASRARLLAIYGLEYLLLGLATAVFGVGAGWIAAAVVVRHVMDVTFKFMPGAAIAVALGAVGVTIALGLIGTVAALSQKPATVLRHL